MNKQTLHYHTRLHDWYRQHCIQQEKQQQVQHQQRPQSAMVRQQQKVSEAIKQGSLTNDKMYTIDEWCSEVNRTLFCIKKKEASPLYRKCRLSASTKSALSNKPSDPRRIKSAEVFTRTGFWAKQPKPVVNGGELLPKYQGTTEKSIKDGSRISSAVSTKNQSKVEFCIRNSKDTKTYNDEPLHHPRVNHDSLDVRNNIMTQKQQSNNNTLDKSVVLSPRFVPGALKSSNTKTFAPEAGQVPRAKTVTVNYVINSLVREEELASRHSESEQVKNIRNSEDSKKNRTFSASQRSVRTTEINSSVLGGDEGKVALNAVVKFCDQEAVPTFCNTCSGIYSGNTPPPPTPATCASCVHGINLLGSDLRQPPNGPSPAEIQKELAQKLVRTEKVYGERITSAKIDLKMSESRLTEDSLHYSAERDIVRNPDAKPGFSMPNPFDDLEDERNISFQDDGSNLSQNNEKSSGSNVSMESPLGEKTSDMSMERGNEDKGIQIGDSENTEHNDSMDNMHDLTSSQDRLGLDVQKEFFERRGSRRMSISYTYKPQVSSISKSNDLLRVLSIDDCKMAMRYNPHKVLEDHEVTDNPMTELIKQRMGTFESEPDDFEGDSQVAMRLSQNSSVTSLHSSSANDATVANKLHYKVLFGPEDLNQYHNLRPRSAYLNRAFKTMIHDRTIMQRLDEPGSLDKAKNSCALTRTVEGPKYKIINTALKREMGNMLQAQRQKLIHKYEQQKRGSLKQPRSSSRLSKATDRSLSLDSLPSMKKGILKHSE